MKCAICNCEINDSNNTKEHIIPNCIGGRKKISNFICENCNNESGETWEKDLCESLNPLSIFFDIKRERGKVPSQKFSTTSGQSFEVFPNSPMKIGEPVFEKIVEDNGDFTIRMISRSFKEAKTRLKGIKKKYPELDLEEAIKNLTIETEYVQERLHVSLCFGYKSSGKSIVKSVLALVADKGIDVNNCEVAIDYLRNENVTPCFRYIYETDPILNRPKGVPLHCVYVVGDPEHNSIFGYLEYFGVQRVLVCLSKNYTGSDFTNQYSINPTNAETLELDFTFDEIEVLENDILPQNDLVQSVFNDVFIPRMEQSLNAEQEKVVSQAVDYAFKNCGAEDGEILNEEHIKILPKLIIERMESFLINKYIPSITQSDNNNQHE